MPSIEVSQTELAFIINALLNVQEFVDDPEFQIVMGAERDELRALQVRLSNQYRSGK